jgi:transcriptional regulator with XRE-family HTH domain
MPETKQVYRVKELALARGIKNQRQLMFTARLNQQAAQRLWKGSGDVLTETLIRVAQALDVSIGELFIGGCNESRNEKNGNNVVESEGNGNPALVDPFTIQQARGAEVLPAFATSLPTEQARVPYRKAA